MENRKNIIVIILVVIIAVLSSIIGWLIGSKNNDIEKDNDNSLNTEQVQENNENNLESIANNLFDTISDVSSCGEIVLDLGEDNKLVYNELQTDYLNRMVANSLFVNKKVNIDETNKENTKYFINKDDFEFEYKSLFGHEVNFVLPQTFYSGFIKFDLSDNIYNGEIIYGIGCGGEAFGEYLLDKYELINNKFYLTVSLVYSVGENKYIVDPNVDVLDENLETYTKEELLENYGDEIIKYKYTFNLKNDNYIFESIQLAN